MLGEFLFETHRKQAYRSWRCATKIGERRYGTLAVGPCSGTLNRRHNVTLAPNARPLSLLPFTPPSISSCIVTFMRTLNVRVEKLYESRNEMRQVASVNFNVSSVMASHQQRKTQERPSARYHHGNVDCGIIVRLATSPFGKMRKTTIHNNVWNGYRPTIPEGVCENLKKVIESCFCQSPDQRPTSKELVESMRRFATE